MLDPGLAHAAEFRRCLVELDIDGIRRLWAHVSPHLPQPKNDDEALHCLHLARTKTHNLPLRLRQYSEEWLAERERNKVACAVGISVKTSSRRPSRVAQAIETRLAMEDSVMSSYKAGLDLDKDANEVRRRMMIARDKV